MSKILFLGDLYYDYSYISFDIEKIINFVKQNDYKCILNLEAPFYAYNSKPRLKIGPNLFQNDITIQILKELNVIGVTLANNHILDFGKESLMKTIEILKENNIQYCGAGLTKEEAIKPMTFKINDLVFDVYNYGWNIEGTKSAKSFKCGSAPRKQNVILKNIRKSNNFCINIMHWGFEYSLFPQPMDVNLAHKMIDNGCDLILGHHPHVIQSHELYNNKDIFYSLGNFYFSSRRDRFKRYVFNTNPTDRCNYGLGLVFDVETKKVEQKINFYYDNQTKETVILVDEEKRVLTDITNINVNTKRYRSKIKANRQNKNPIYTTNSVSNFFRYIKQKLYSWWCLIGIKFSFIDSAKKQIKKIIGK